MAWDEARAQRRVEACRRAAPWAGAIGGALGAAALLGWWPGLPGLRAIARAPVMPNAALSLVLAGIALVLVQTSRPGSLGVRAGRVAAALVIALGGLALLQVILHVDLGIDRLLAPSRLDATVYPSRFSLQASVNFVLIGAACLLLSHPLRPRYPTSQALAAGAFLVAFVALLGHLFMVRALEPVPYASMAVTTALGFAALSLSVLLARADRGFMAVVTGDTTGGMMARRLLPAAVLIPMLVAWLMTVGERANWYDSATGASAMTLTMSVLLVALVWVNAARLHEADSRRKAALGALQTAHDGLELRVRRRTAELESANEALRASEDRFRRLSEALPELLWIGDSDGRLAYCNQRWTDYTALAPDQILGLGWQELVHPEDRERVMARWTETSAAGSLTEMQYRLRGGDGRYRWFLSRAVPVRDAEGRVTQWLGSCTDVEDLRRAQSEVEDLNVQLKRAMVETHHRVRNSLQILAALIEIQETEEEGAAGQQRLRQHVRVLSAIHDLLTEQARGDGHASGLGARDLLEALVPLLRQVACGRAIEFTSADVRLPIRAATSLGLVANELVSNAIKHARSRVRVGFSVAGGRAVLVVSDDGPGYPDERAGAQTRRHGLDLVEGLTAWDLSGEVHYENPPEGGARASVTFPVPAAPKDL